MRKNCLLSNDCTVFTCYDYQLCTPRAKITFFTHSYKVIIHAFDRFTTRFFFFLETFAIKFIFSSSLNL